VWAHRRRVHEQLLCTRDETLAACFGAVQQHTWLAVRDTVTNEVRMKIDPFVGILP
jgi:hypothetical protein